MKIYLILLIITLNFSLFSQMNHPNKIIIESEQLNGEEPALGKLLYAGFPNHIEIVEKAFHLAEINGFIDTIGINDDEILDRLKAGAYGEDFEQIPGTVGEHFPEPWNTGPDFDFYGYYPISKIPYGSYLDSLSGWSRGLYHGFDPVQGFHWPGTNLTTIEWTNYQNNNFSWDKAVGLYQSGQKAEAYECLGHVLHLLADLSIPAHVNVIKHGINISSIHSGTVLDPDILELVVDEYELALAGGVSIPGIYDFIPNLLNTFRSDLNLADPHNVEILGNWSLYFNGLAESTYYNAISQQYFSPPDSEGGWGHYLNGNGNRVNPHRYFLTLPAQISGRWVQISLECTATEQGTVFPGQQIAELCSVMVPRSVEYCAGLILYFLNYVTGTEKELSTPSEFYLSQNYPNPFNPSTNIQYRISSRHIIEIKVYDILGKEVAVLVSEDKPAGVYEISWNAEDMSSGVYFYQIRAMPIEKKGGSLIEIKKMILMR